VRGQTAFLEMKGQKLDLGGIAKGAAGDEIKAELKYRGREERHTEFRRHDPDDRSKGRRKGLEGRDTEPCF
jgi:hypothetical protein